MSRLTALEHRSRAASASAVLLATSTFVFDPFGFDRWVFAKEGVLILAAILAWFGSPIGRAPRWSRWWFCAAFVLLLVGAATASAPWAQLFGRWPRYEGFVTLGAYALAFAVGARALGGSPSHDETARHGRVFLRVFTVGIAVTAVIAGCESLGLRPIPSDLLRPGSLLGNASDLGIVGVIGFALYLPPFLELAAARSSRDAAVVSVGFMASLVTVVLSASRGALVGAVVVSALLAALAWRRGERNMRWWGGFALAISVGLSLCFVLPFTAGRILGTTVDSAASAANRTELWTASASVISSSPIVGIGASGFADAVTNELYDDWYATTGIGGWTESPHNVLLQVGAAGGAAGFILLASAILLALVHVRRHGSRGPFGASALVAGVGASGALMFHFTSPGTTMLLCLLLGSALAARTDRKRDSRQLDLAVASALVVWFLALVLAVAGDHRLRDGMQSLREEDMTRASVHFEAAKVLRLWDADLPLIVSEALASAIESASSSGAAPSAEAWSAEAVDRLPSSTRALKAAAVVAQYEGKFGRGVDLMERAASLSPTDPQVFHRLGALQFLAGHRHPALASLERAEALAPDDSDIRATLEYVRTGAGIP